MIIDIALLLAAILLIIIGARVRALGGAAKAAMWFAFYCYVASLITILELMAHYSPTEEVARVWGQFAAVWPLAWVFYVHFAAASTNVLRRRQLTLSVVYLAGSVIAVSYFLLARSGRVVSATPDFGYSLESPFVNSPLGVVVAVAYATIVAITLTTLIREALHNQGPSRGRQIRWILLAYGLGFAVGVGAVLVREIGGLAIRELNGLAYLVTASVIYTGIVSQRLVQLTPELVARQALAEVDECFLLTDERNHVVTLNWAAVRTLGVTQEQAAGRDLRDLIGCELNAAGDGDVTIHRGSNEPIVLSLSQTVTRSRFGEVIGRIFIGRDMTVARAKEQQLRSLLKEKDLLLRELHHRVGNTLQVLDGLVSIKAAGLGPDKSIKAIQEISERIHLMSHLYYAVYAEGTLQSIQLERVLREVSEHYRGGVSGHDEQEFQLDLAPLWISVETAVPLLLAVTELISNACRHAYARTKPGTIRIESGRSSPSSWSIVISDDGHGIVGEPPPTATGVALARELIRQVGGTMEAAGDHGTTWRITLPNEG